MCPFWYSSLRPEDQARFLRWEASLPPVTQPTYVQVWPEDGSRTVWVPIWQCLHHPIRGRSLPYVGYVARQYPAGGGPVFGTQSGMATYESVLVPGLYQVMRVRQETRVRQDYLDIVCSPSVESPGSPG